MNTRTLLIGIAVTCATFAFAVFPAAADPVSVTVTLGDGNTIQVQADVDPCTGKVSLPDLPGPVSNVQVPSLPCPQNEPPPTSSQSSGGDQGAQQPQPTQPQATQPQATTPSAGSNKPQARDKGSRQKTTDGTKGETKQAKRKARKKADRGSKDKGSSHARNDHKADPGSSAAPTAANPTLSVASVGPAPVGVPNFFIDKFRIPPFLLPIYQAAGTEYGVRWEVLAAINEIETDYGRNLNISSAGAVGWMQFMPSTWKRYGVDANGDGLQDPYSPVDAIFAAARYHRAAGAENDISRAIFASNNADWYVDSDHLRAKVI
ncbi:MAG: lytic transglycosylase domain-containing protein, partial [Solirubrobacteraceae bacterium]